RRAKELAMGASLDGDDEQARRIREAESTLADPVRRSADALMWLRIASGDVPSDLDPTDGKAVSAALAAPDPRPPQGDEDAVQAIAVIPPAAALEDPALPLTRWQTGLGAWGSLLARDRFWRAERLRADLAGDPRLRAATIDTQRAELPWRVLEPSARLI